MPIDIDTLKPYRSAVDDNRHWAGFTPRPGDIVVCTPAKCGTTWTQTIVASLLWPAGNAPGRVTSLAPWIEAKFTAADEIHAMLEAQTHRRFMKSHTPADGVPMFPDARYIVVGRDGRDAFMSMCNHSARFKAEVRQGLNERAAAEGLPPMPDWNGDIHDFFQGWLQMGSLFQHVASFWPHRDDANMLFVHYADLKRDLGGEMRRIAAFLEIPISVPQWPAVVERCTFESMRNRGDEIGSFESRFEGGAQGFLFKGTNGRWRDVLTEEELALYQRRASEFLSPEALHWLEFGRNA